MMRLRPVSYLLSLVLLVSGVERALARDTTHYGSGFTIDLDEPYERVLQVVKTVSEDGVVRGTSEYKGSAEIYGAVPGTGSNACRTPPVPGTVLYKIRKDTIAPEHFYQSNDVGTLAVRYVVKALGPNSTRLNIDAIFQED